MGVKKVRGLFKCVSHLILFRTGHIPVGEHLARPQSARVMVG